MADPKDDFDPDFEPGTASGDFDPDFEPTVAPIDSTPSNGQQSEWWEDLALGAVDGLTLNNGAELGHLGEGIGNAMADAAEGVWGTDEIDGMEPIKAGDSDLDLEALYALARTSPAGQVGHAAGLLNSGIAMAGMAPTTVGGQAIAGGLSGGLASGGDSGYDPATTAAGAGTGAALGGLGGALGKGADSIRRWLSGAAPVAKEAQMALPGMAPKAMTNAEKLAEKLALSFDDATRLPTATSKLVGQGALKLAQSPVASGELLRSAGGAASTVGPQVMTSLFGTQASAQDSRPFTEVELVKPGPWRAEIGDAHFQTIKPVIGEAEFREKAYAGQPAMIYSVQSILSSGNSGLPEKAQRDLTSALLSGDEGKVDAINFKLQQRHPAYAKRLQDELKALSEE